MKLSCCYYVVLLLFLSTSSCVSAMGFARLSSNSLLDLEGKTIQEIVVKGNNQVSSEAILNKIPYRIGQKYSSLWSGQAIRNIFGLGFFKQVFLKAKKTDDNHIKLFAIVQEKRPLQEIIFKGNSHLSQKEIEKKIDLSGFVCSDPVDIDALKIALKRLYREKNYHNVSIDHTISEVGPKDIVTINVTENKPTCVKRVDFIGNKAFSGKKLRSLIFTREDWILGFMDRSGSYQPDAIESDRYTLENFYQSNGYFHAKVTEVEKEVDPTTQIAHITFHIHEGDLYTINQVRVLNEDILPEKDLLPLLPIQPGQLYSREIIRETMEALRGLWGQRGYIYVDVVPAIEPDDATKTVKVSFLVDPGDKVYVNRINVTGNKKTRDKIIRRQLLLAEGELLTTQKVEESKKRVEGLGYFEQREGVNWKLSRINQEYADIDFVVQEVKTGRLEAQLGFGGSPKDLQSPATSARLVCSFSDTNLFGLGLGINLSGAFSKEEKQLLFNITEPWLFDRPIYAAFDVALKRSIYEEFNLVTDDIQEHLASGSISSGFISKRLNGVKFITQLGAEGIHYAKEVEINTQKLTNEEERIEFTRIMSNRFSQGAFGWLGWQAVQDLRNHPLQPTCGYQWALQTKVGFPGWSSKFGFWKLDCDGTWYTPLIGERTLVLSLHGHLGLVAAFKNKEIPFRELYHIGGPSSVRGFLFGEIGPMYKGIDSLGATKAFWFNAEISFPIAPDYSIKGALFYDGGSGWDTPHADQINPARLRHNNFDFRHSIGFGLRILRPTPLKVDWGYKLDRRKGESSSEIHLSMAHDF